MRRVRIGMAGCAVARDASELSTYGLGSCVAIALYDPAQRIGALGHIMLPSPALARGARGAGTFPDTAVPHMLEEMYRLGARQPIIAKLVGGARMFATLMPQGVLSMGERNVQATREALRRAGVALVAQDTGGDFGRSVRFDTGTGVVTVQSHAREPHVI